MKAKLLPVPRSSSLPNLNDNHGLVIANAFINGVPYIQNQAPESAYAFLRELGRGEYARTWLVKRQSCSREFACKEILKGNTTASYQRARREAEVHSVLNGHPNIAGLMEVWEDRNSFYMFMELCGGGELYHAISERGSLTESESASVLKVVLQVLQHCHSKGIVHRDVKPENFMLRSNNRRLEKSNIVAIDFGCSCYARAGQKLWEVVGSPMYLAPEAVAGIGYNFEADIWAAGVLLFSMLSGLSLFITGTDEQICSSVLHQPIDLEGEPWPFVSQEAKNLVHRLLERDPEQRIPIQGALNSPWMHKLTAPSSQPLNLWVVDRLQAFAGFTDLQRILLNLCVVCQPASRKHLQRLFDDLDTNGDGILDQSELHRGAQDMGKPLTQQVVKELVTALDITGIGGVKLTQFLAAAGDRRSNSACSLLDKAPIIQSAVEGFIHISDIANVLASSGIAITPEKLLFLASAADITIVDNLMRLQDLEDHLLECRPSYQSVIDSHHLQSQSKSTLIADKAEADASRRDSCRADSSDLDMECSIDSPSPRCCSPELSHPFFFQHRHDDEKAGGTKSAGPLFPEGGSSPSSESAWAKMLADRSQGRSLGSCAGESEGSAGLRYLSGNLFGGSPEGSIISSQDAFTSGGVTYWTAKAEESSDFEREEEAEDSDALFGAALTAKAGHR